jgi:predicted dehydrogenase
MKTEHPLRIGVLGCGPIAQAGHFESCTKAKNAELFAICDVADDLLARMAATHVPQKSFTDYDAMLADPDLEAVIIATADAFHVEAAIRALEAGKHVLCEKPLGISVEEVLQLEAVHKASGKQLMVGHMKRFDPGLQAAKRFVDTEMGQMLAYKGWYCDSTHRYPMTDAVQPLMVKSARIRKPSVDPKADKERYFMLAHGCHLVDLARFFAGDIVAVNAKLVQRFGAFSWFIETEFANGANGHLDLTVAVRMDWHEGLTIYGEHGSVTGKIFNPWYFKSSEVDIFREADGASTRTLGADGHFYRRQVEAFATLVREGRDTGGATLADGLASVRGMAAIMHSVRSGKSVKLSDMTGSV